MAMLDDKVLVTARKGIFGHGMAVSGGWELMAQHLGLARGVLQPQPRDDSSLNPEVAAVPFRYVLDHDREAPPGPAGKLSMGVGGINACVISSPWGSEEARR